MNAPGSLVGAPLQAQPSPAAPPGWHVDASAWQREMERAAALAAQAPVQPLAAWPRGAGGAPPTERAPGKVATPAADAERRPVRVHAERQGDAVRVWLGVDAGDATRLPRLLPALSRGVAVLGLRLRSVVCNGQTVFEAPCAYVHGAPPIPIDTHEET